MILAGEPLAELSWRVEAEADEEFLLGLYIASRQHEFAMLPLTDDQKTALLAGQSRMQRAHYRTTYPRAEFLVIEHGGAPVGRLCLDGGVATDLRIVDIALLPDRRNQGLGTALLRAVLERAEREGRTASLHVGQANPAIRLYERLGFRRVERRGPDWLMVRSP